MKTFYVYQGVTVSGLYVFKDKQPDYMTKDCVEHKCISVDKDLDSYIYFIQHQHDVVKKENAELTRKVADYEAALNFYSLKSNYSLIDEGRNYNVDYKCYELDEETYADVEIGTKAREVLQKYKGKKCSHPDYNLEGPGVKICKECGVYL